MKSAAEMLMRLLQAGGRVEVEGHVYALSEEGDICWVDSDGNGHATPCDVKDFIRLAERVGRDELWLSCCAFQLGD